MSWCDKRTLPVGARKWIANRLRFIRREAGRKAAADWKDWFFDPDKKLGPGGRRLGR